MYDRITESHRSEFRPTWLYVKRHTVTGLKYFGKTVIDDPSYLGSGVWWNRHLKTHGKDKVETVWSERFDNIDDLVEFALLFSELFDIAKSPSWANLIPENGVYGGAVKGRSGRKWSVDEKKNQSDRMLEIMSDSAIRKKCADAKRGKSGPKQTDEAKAKIGYAQRNLSETQRLNKGLAKVGEKNGMFGRKVFNDGVINKSFVPGEEPPGWKRGRLFTSVQR